MLAMPRIFVSGLCNQPSASFRTPQRREERRKEGRIDEIMRPSIQSREAGMDGFVSPSTYIHRVAGRRQGILCAENKHQNCSKMVCHNTDLEESSWTMRLIACITPPRGEAAATSQKQVHELSSPSVFEFPGNK